ncbi:MAG: ABC transporter related protein [Parcubacteria group bacterium GW2011_GWF2_39_8b]|nr:MAG: ABC transporter related protein [Parcubacteria group bacterium GW2011_GWF2_39_8b]KKR46093.1 MAG: ABC transporter related protein [Parcubacteria group bacterium GW2011_GWA2_40_14]
MNFMNSTKPAIEIKNIGKKYNINHQGGGYVTLREVIMETVKSPIKSLKSKIKQVIGKDQKEEFWALDNVSFNVKRGEIIGIIGPNGAGKSTLLKILSQITPPTTGEIKISGSVGSLLEVGTGFHPELTGRENIFLNGAILGMTRKQTARKFNEIVEFSGIGKFLDTPVKHYSSGMYVRLAFSVAAHMEPDILIVDEVLAVGDAEFQKKCLGKMNDITKSDGRTIIFVSHNLDAIERLCTKTILLKKGKIIKVGETSDVINYYLNVESSLNSIVEFKEKSNLQGQIKKVTILDKNNEPRVRIPVSEKFFIEIELDIKEKLEQKMIFLHFYYHGEIILVSTEGDKTGVYKNYDVGTYKTRVEIPAYLFQVGMLFLNIDLKHLTNMIDQVIDISIEITNENSSREPISGDNYWGKISTILDYKTIRINE